MSAETQTALELSAEPVPVTQSPFVFNRLMRLLPSREGAFWVLFAQATPKMFGPVFTIVLRRFLGPGASGNFDQAFVPYKFLDNFRNFGTGPALVYERTVSRSIADTAWTLNMSFAVIVTLVAQILAHPIAVYYGHPEVESIFRLLSIAYLFASLTSVHSFLLLRDMDFRARSIPPLGQVIIAGDFAMLFAVWGYGVGSFVARELASVIAGTLLLWIVYPFRPKPEIVRAHAWKLFKYGAWVGAGLTILYMSQNVDVFIGGHIIHNSSDIGFYTTSWKLSFIAAGIFTTVASSMVFPALSRQRDNIEGLRRTLLISIRQIGLIMFPAAALLAAVAPVAIVPILGHKWTQYRDSFLVLSLLAVYAGNRTMLSIFFEGYKSIGRPSLVWSYNTVKLAIMVPAMIYGASHGILGLAMTYIPIQILEFPIALVLARRVLGVSIRQVWGASRLAILATLGMCAAAISVEVLFLSVLHAGDLPTLAASLATAALGYVGILYVFNRRVLFETGSILTKGL
jgi:O-antigen/teichoic acid export membrane protein